MAGRHVLPSPLETGRRPAEQRAFARGALFSVVAATVLAWTALGDLADWSPALARAATPAASPAAADGPGQDRSVAGAGRAASVTGQAEQRLAEAWRHARQGDLAAAQAEIDTVLQALPDFRPALTLNGVLADMWLRERGEASLLATRARPALPPPPGALVEETGLRLAAHLTPAPASDAAPANLLQVAEPIETVLAADVAASRLYVLRHHGDNFTRLDDFYLSTGLHGAVKLTPGDQRTPIGIYQLANPLPASSLPSVAGTGAWPLDFPNRWDQWRGHLGSGIWLHGSPSGQIDGPPHSTNGCLALSNQDLERLTPLLAGRTTVLLVAEHIEWISPDVRRSRRRTIWSHLQGRDLASLERQHPSIFVYPGESALLLVRSNDKPGRSGDRFWRIADGKPVQMPPVWSSGT